MLLKEANDLKVSASAKLSSLLHSETSCPKKFAAAQITCSVAGERIDSILKLMRQKIEQNENDDNDNSICDVPELIIDPFVDESSRAWWGPMLSGPLTTKTVFDLTDDIRDVHFVNTNEKYMLVNVPDWMFKQLPFEQIAMELNFAQMKAKSQNTPQPPPKVMLNEHLNSFAAFYTDDGNDPLAKEFEEYMDYLKFKL